MKHRELLKLFLECQSLISLSLNRIFLYIVLLFYENLIILLYQDLKILVFYYTFGVLDTSSYVS